MTDAVRVIAAGVTFVELVPKILSHAVKLREMWDQFKEIPDSIESLFAQIEIHGSLLQHMTPSTNSSTPDGGAWICSAGALIVVYCREAVDVLSKSVDEVSQELSSARGVKRAVLKAKLVLKRDFWAKTEQRLQRVASMLVLAVQLWSNSSITRGLDMVISLTRNNIQRGQVGDPDITQEETHEQFAMMIDHAGRSLIGSIGVNWTRSSEGSRRGATPRTNGGIGCDKFYFQFKPPTWLSQKAWSIASSISTCGFDVQLRVYSVVPSTSPVFMCARRGDIEGLLDLFDRKLASPFDMDEDGFSLLHFALWSGQTQVAVIMIDWGLDLSQFFDPEKDSSGWLSLLAEECDRPSPTLQAIHELALANNVYDEYADCWLHPGDTLDPVVGYAKAFLFSSPGPLKLLLPYLRPGHYHLPVQDRLLLMCTFYFENVRRIDCLRYALWSDGKASQEDIQALDAMGIPLIKFMIWYYGLRPDPVMDCSEVQARRQLRRCIIPWTTLLHSYDDPVNTLSKGLAKGWQGTALHAIIKINDSPGFHCQDHLAFSQWRRATERSLQHWLEDLQEGGIDLNEYGKMESNIFVENAEIKKIVYWPDGPCWDHRWRYNLRCLLAAFSYGPEPKDWKFTWDVGNEELLGEFWEFIDNPPLDIPGAWVDCCFEDF